jgi:predicted dipeptidase
VAAADTPPLPAESAGSRSAAEVARERLAAEGAAQASELTARLVEFQTVAEADPPADGRSFAELESFLRAWAVAHGLELRVVGARDVWEVVLAGARRDRPPALRLLTHADVAPVNDPPALVEPGAIPEGWTSPPFAPRVSDGQLWGRGTQDDKGAVAAALVAMAALREAGFVPRGDVVLAIGTAEEHEWEGMIRYAEAAPPADQSLSLDADYPVVTAEAGFVHWELRAPVGRRPAGGRRPVALAAEGGLFLTQVPEEASLLLAPRGEPCEALLERARAAAASVEAPFRAAAELVGPGELGRERCAVRVRTQGRAVHSSVADQGHNALWPLAAIARRLDVAAGGTRTVLDVVAETFAGDHHGERLGLSYDDPFMGRLLVAPTLLRVEGENVSLGINMRRPRGRTSGEFAADLDRALSRLRADHPEVSAAPDAFVGEPHVVDADAPVVRALLDLYGSVTGDRDAGAVSMRGGSYARLFPGTVSFGPVVPGDLDLRHAPDERVPIASLALVARLTLEAAILLTSSEP